MKPAAPKAAAAAADEEEEDDDEDDDDDDEDEDDDEEMKQAPSIAVGVKRKAKVLYTSAPRCLEPDLCGRALL